MSVSRTKPLNRGPDGKVDVSAAYLNALLKTFLEEYPIEERPKDQLVALALMVGLTGGYMIRDDEVKG